MSKTIDLSNRVFAVLTILIVTIVGFSAFKMYEIWNNANTGGYPRELFIEAEGSATMTPDLGKIMLGVYTEAETQDQAVDENAEIMNRIIENLDNLDVEEEDIETVDYYLSPNYEWDDEIGSYEDGYYLDQTIEVTIRDLDIVDEVITASSSAGADMIGNVNFTAENTDEAVTEARENAIANAKEKAEQIAEVSGIKLGRVVDYYEYDYNDDYYYGKGYEKYSDSYMEIEEISYMESPRIEPGDTEVTISVSMTYLIK